MTTLLTTNLMQQAEAVTDWQEAITLAAQPLLNNQYIEETYIEGMINSVKKSGAYIVLAPHVAVPHAASELGVRKLGISLLKLKQPVDFNMDGETDIERLVHLIFVLAAVDSTSHLKALQQLAMVLDDEENIQKMIQANTNEEVLRIIEGIIQEGAE